jgi:hypothetical protein
MSRIVYFVQDIETGLIKIGYSGNFEARLPALRILATGPIEIVFTCPGSFSLESRIHQFLRDHRRDGEWFEPHPDFFSLVDRLKAGEEFDLLERQEQARQNQRGADREQWLRDTFSMVIQAAYGQEPGWAQRAANDAGVSAECIKNWVKKLALPNGASLINFGRANLLIRLWVRLSIVVGFIAERFDISEGQAAELIERHPHLSDLLSKGTSQEAAVAEVRKVLSEEAA